MPVEFATDGIYVCGSARWPTDIPEGISQAYAAAAKTAIPMRRGKISPEAITSFVNEEKCSGCGVCVELCPYQALEFLPRDGKRVSHVITALCKGCGTCGAACPSGAISINHYRDEQIFAQIEALAKSI
jgi:heterodisulfide reductase subunit A